MQDAERETFQIAIGYSFRDPTLLLRALTHKSYSHERNAPASGTEEPANEQLEFLGDAVLGLLVSEVLFAHYPQLNEGQLSKLKAHLVSAARLVEVAKALNLGEHLRLGRGEEMSGGREKKALLSDAVEALLAAIYLDGGLEAARAFVLKNVFGGSPENLEPAADVALLNFKSALQEYAHAHGLPAPRYVVVGTTGPEHAKTFIVEARLGQDLAMQAEAPSKKAAGQKAAELLLEKLTAVNPGA